jgi:hypothetical protein
MNSCSLVSHWGFLPCPCWNVIDRACSSGDRNDGLSACISSYPSLAPESIVARPEPPTLSTCVPPTRPAASCSLSIRLRDEQRRTVPSCFISGPSSRVTRCLRRIETFTWFTGRPQSRRFTDDRLGLVVERLLHSGNRKVLLRQ